MLILTKIEAFSILGLDRTRQVTRSFGSFRGVPSFSTMFPLISAPGTYLILKLLGAVLTRGRRFKEGAVCFNVRKIIHMKFKNFLIFSFQITINDQYCDV